MGPCQIMLGLLNLNKPAGVSSRRVVDQVAHLVRPLKAGHAGTLDPLASGVLVVGVGRATRLIEFVQQLPKSYRATFLLGRTSTTDDVEGEITPLREAAPPSLAALAAAALRLTGTIRQRPPAYSALKVAGRRAYALARRGQEVRLAEREVTVRRFELVRYAYPELEAEIDCGSGTYVRALGRDLAEAVGSGAVMSALVRTAIGQFRLDDALDPQELTLERLQQALQPPLAAVAHLPQVTLSAVELAQVARGLAVAKQFDPAARHLAALDESGELAAVLVPRGAGWLGPAVNLRTD